MLARQRGNRHVERLWRLATNARRAPIAWALMRNRRRASSARCPLEATVLQARQLQRARPAPRAARALVGLPTRVREQHCRAALGVCDIAGKFCVTVGEWDVTSMCNAQSRVPAPRATPVRQRVNRPAERLYRPATNARRALTVWATAHNRRRASSAQFLRGNTARLVRQLQRARPVQWAARAPAGRRTRVREMHCRAARGVCDIAGKFCVTVGECDV